METEGGSCYDSPEASTGLSWDQEAVQESGVGGSVKPRALWLS